MKNSFIMLFASFLILLLTVSCNTTSNNSESNRPNILFCIADDWGWPHAGAYGDQVVNTPTFDRLAENGVLYTHAYVSSPSCTPSRSSILTGQYHWRLDESANLWSTLDINHPVYPLILEEAGYFTGSWRKAWGPGDLKAGGYTDKLPAGRKFKGGFEEFISQKPADKPFCFWLGASDPHRPYKEGSGRLSGINPDNIIVPGFYPDVDIIRSDIADYYYEVQRFDNDVAKALKLLEERGELENTIVVMTGDNGMPFPRCKSNIYDMGVRMPLAIMWGNTIKGDRELFDFVSLTDLAPTFLDAAGINPPDEMTGKSLLKSLKGNKQGWVDKSRQQVVFGKERHTPAQLAPSMGGYPCRGIRTDKYLYIRNFEADRWPAGVPENATHPMNSFSDCDNSPTKSFLLENKDSQEYINFYKLSFSKRPSEELYNMEEDPFQLINLANMDDYTSIMDELSAAMEEILSDSGDPRIVGGGEIFDSYTYRSGYNLNPPVSKK